MFWSSNSLGVYFNERIWSKQCVSCKSQRECKDDYKGNHMLTMNDMVGADAVGTWMIRRPSLIKVIS